MLEVHFNPQFELLSFILLNKWGFFPFYTKALEIFLQTWQIAVGFLWQPD